jgi:hypothetical protein
VDAQGEWNAAYDLWLHRTRPEPGVPTVPDLEVMVWLEKHGEAVRPYGEPQLEGACQQVPGGDETYQVYKGWMPYSEGSYKGGWWVVSFLKCGSPLTQVKDFDLKRFIAYTAERWPEAASLDMWLGSVEAGYELWSTGAQGRARSLSGFSVELRQ